MASISAAKLREGQRGVAAYDGRELPCLDEVNQGVDEGSTVRARVERRKGVVTALAGGASASRATSPSSAPLGRWGS